MKKMLIEVNRLLNDNKTTRNLKNVLYLAKEELEVQLLCNNCYEEMQKKALEMSKKIKNVQFGCGTHILNDYINVDINSCSDIIWDVREILPFENETIVKIFSEHMLEHLDFPVSVNNFFKESYRILKQGGELIIGVPDCDFPLKDIQEMNTKNMKLAINKWYNLRKDVLSNLTNSINYLNYVMHDQLFDKTYHPHYWGYNENNLKELFLKHGFQEVEIWKPDMKIINPKRLWGTIYLKGVKK